MDNIKFMASYRVKEIISSNTTVNYELDMINEVCNVFNEVCSLSISSSHIDKDMEAELGMDSLQRIRIITRLTRKYKNVDRNSLFECRSIREMMLHISKGINIYPNNSSIKEEKFNTHMKSNSIPYIKIAEQCKMTPNAEAINYGNKSVSYFELDQLSNKIANYLRKQN